MSGILELHSFLSSAPWQVSSFSRERASDGYHCIRRRPGADLLTIDEPVVVTTG